MNKAFLWFVATLSGIFLFLAGLHATWADGGPLVLPNPLSSLGQGATLLTVVQAVASFLLFIAAPLCGIMVIVGGFQMMTAAGNPTKFSNGRKTLIYAAVGFVIVLFASSIVPLLKNILSGT